MNGGPDEFAEFYRSHYRRLLAAVIAAGGELHQAEDALESGMVAAFVSWDSIRKPDGYVYKAALHHLIKDKKLTQKEEATPPDDHGVEPDHATGQEIWEQEEWVTAILDRLPPAQREVLAYMIEAFKPAEIAVLLGKTPAAVRQNLCAARKRLKQYLAETNGAEITAAAYGEEAR